MGTLRRSARLYLGAIVLAALGLLGVALARGGAPDGPRLALALAFAVLAALAYRFPLPFGPKTKVTLGSAVLFAAVLLFPPAAAMLVAGAGRVAGEASRRRGWREIAFNSAQSALQAGAGAALLAAGGWTPGVLRFDRAWAWPLLAAAAGAIIAVNTVAVATMVGLQTGQPPLAVWRRQLRAFDWAEHGAQLALGLLAALAIEHHPWVLPLLALPALTVYQALLRHAELRQRVEDALLAEVGRLAAAPALPDARAGMVEAAGRSLGDGALLFLAAPGRAELDLAACYHRDPEVRARQRRVVAADPPRRGAGAIGSVAAGGPALLLRDALTGAGAGGGSALAALGFRAALCVPVRHEARMLGVLVVGAASRQRPLDERDLAVAEAVAGQIGAALAQAGLREELAAAAAELRAALEGVEQGVLLTDVAGQVRFVNRRLEALTGLDLRDLVGHPAREAAARLGGHLAGGTLVAGEGLAGVAGPAGAEIADEIALARPDGRVLARQSGPVRDPGGAIVGQLAVFSDVTEARRREHARDEVLAIAGHELKAPLTAVGGYLQLLEAQLGRPGGADPVRLARYTGTALEELARLDRLAEDLLAVARVETGLLPLRTAALDLAALARAVAARFAARPDLAATGHAVRCTAADALPACGDALRLEQVLVNLLGNAVKYSPAGGEIAVTAERAGAEAIIAVRDHGLGIPPEERSRIFEPFYRAGGAAVTAAEGLGLGLHISRGVVEAHGGRIWADAAPGGGSVFRFALPLEPGTGGAPAPAVAGQR